MEITQKSFPLRYGVSLLSTAVGVALRAALIPWLGTESPYITLFPAVAVAALFGGFGAGLLAAALGGVAANFLLQPDQFSFTDSKSVLPPVLFFLTGGFISWIASERQRARVLLQLSEKRARASEQALQSSEQKWLLAQKSAGVGIWELDLATRRAEWSAGIYKLLGMEETDARSRAEIWEDFLLPEDRARVVDEIEQAIAGDQSELRYEFRVRRQDDGAVRWIAAQARLARNPHGEALKMYGVNYDITERVESELRIKTLNQELNRRVHELETIFDIAPVGIAFALDPECNVILPNPALARMVGVAPGENISSNEHRLPYKHFRNGRELAAHELPMQRAVAEKRPILNEEIDILRPDGKIVTIYGYAAPIFDDRERVISCVAAQIDITTRKQAELAREKEFDAEQSLRRQAEEANRLKDEFLATVSHELRTPLNAILGWSTMLRGGRLAGESAQRAIESIERSAKSQSQLIEDLLDVSRIISGKLKLQLRSVELTKVVAAAVETIRPSAQIKDIALETDLPETIEPVAGDFDRLQQVVWNLLSNAVKFTPKGGRVRVALARRETQCEIAVADTGLGIKPDFLPYVFDRFRQADGSTTRKFTGLGLGLAIVRQLVELHGGSVGVESAGENQGATFRVLLPFAELPAPAEANGAAPEEGRLPADFPVLANLRILVVDDEAETREILKMAFDNCRASVETAASAAEALAVIKTFRPRVIVSDIGMPDEDGFSLMRRIRRWEEESGAPTPVVSLALTAYARGEDRQRAFEAGFQYYFSKPVAPLELTNFIAELLAAKENGE